MSGKPEDNLDDIYSDLSDNQEIVKKKTSTTAKPSQSGVAIKMPSFLGGKAFIPPPPPPTSKPDHRNIITIPDQILQGKSHQQSHSYSQGTHHQGQRQRKSTIYVKNIPKSYNRQETLTTFFRTYGNIKSIKTHQETNSAVIRFQKQQDAYRFMMKKPLILNRSYIIYDTHQDFQVNSEIVAERQKDQVVVVNSTQKQLIIMKQNSQSLIADKYRALLFLNKHSNWLSEQEQIDIGRQIDTCRKIKQTDSHNEQLGEMLSNFENNYDWTLTYKVMTKQPIEKKKVISLYQKYGPIGTIALKLAPVATAIQNATTEGTEDKIGIVKLKFLGVKSSWNMYFDHCESLNLEVEGNKLKSFFKSWFKKQEQLKNTPQEQNREGKAQIALEEKIGNEEPISNRQIKCEQVQTFKQNEGKTEKKLESELAIQQKHEIIGGEAGTKKLDKEQNLEIKQKGESQLKRNVNPELESESRQNNDIK